MKRMVLLYSGGINSTTLIHWAKRRKFKVKCLVLNYGQRNANEIRAAVDIANAMEIPCSVYDLSSIAKLLPGCAMVDPSAEIPYGLHTEDSLKKTAVPNLNMILCSIGVAHALSVGGSHLGIGASSGDSPSYPDCKSEYFEILSRAIHRCDWREIKLVRPFLKRTKAEIVRLGHKLGVPFVMTWSCYGSGKVHCGRCGACIARKKAFWDAGVQDPTEYDLAAPTAEELAQNGWKLSVS